MKKILLIMFVICFLISCQQPIAEKGKDTEKIIYQVIPGTAVLLNQKIFPIVAGSQQSINLDIVQGPTKAVNDYNGGIFYKENAKSYDGIIHTIDLSDKIGKNVKEVELFIQWVDYGKLENITGMSDGSFGAISIYLSTPNTNFTPINLNQNYLGTTNTVKVITDKNGCVNWYHECGDPFDAINEFASPGVHVYQWKKGEIWIRSASDVTVY
jgi:hypothetical protein